jgi:hypothetical protein
MSIPFSGEVLIGISKQNLLYHESTRKMQIYLHLTTLRDNGRLRPLYNEPSAVSRCSGWMLRLAITKKMIEKVNSVDFL